MAVLSSTLVGDAGMASAQSAFFGDLGPTSNGSNTDGGGGELGPIGGSAIQQSGPVSVAPSHALAWAPIQTSLGFAPRASRSLSPLALAGFTRARSFVQPFRLRW